MSHEFLRMQKLSGVITEGEYNQKIEELNSQTLAKKEETNELFGFGKKPKFQDGEIVSVKDENYSKERKIDGKPRKEGKRTVYILTSPKDRFGNYNKDKWKYDEKDIVKGTVGYVDEQEETLNEHVVGVGGTLNPYPAKKKEVYESAFSKFLGEEKDEMEEGKEEVEEYGMKYEEPVDEAKEDLEEDERTDTEEEGYKDGFKDAIKDAKDAISKLRKELKEEDEMEEDLNEDARTDAEEEGYQDGFKDAIKDALDALKGIKGELKEEDIEEMGMRYEEPVEERVTKKEKEEGDMRNKGGESAQTRETERMKSLGRK